MRAQEPDLFTCYAESRNMHACLFYPSYLFYVTGSPERLYDSVKNKILSLPGDFILYPAHDYKGISLKKFKIKF